MLLLSDKTHTVAYTVETFLVELGREFVSGCFPINEPARITDVAHFGNVSVTKPNGCTLSVVYGYMKISSFSKKTSPVVVFTLEGPCGKAFILVDDLLISTYGDPACLLTLDLPALASGEETLECLTQLQQKQHRSTTLADILFVEKLLGRDDFEFTNVASLD